MILYYIPTPRVYLAANSIRTLKTTECSKHVETRIYDNIVITVLFKRGINLARGGKRLGM